MWGWAVGDGENTEVTGVMDTGSMGTMEMWASVEVMSTTEMEQPGAKGWAVHRRISQGKAEEAVEVVWSVVAVSESLRSVSRAGGARAGLGGWNACPA